MDGLPPLASAASKAERPKQDTTTEGCSISLLTQDLHPTAVSKNTRIPPLKPKLYDYSSGCHFLQQIMKLHPPMNPLQEDGGQKSNRIQKKTFSTKDMNKPNRRVLKNISSNPRKQKEKIPKAAVSDSSKNGLSLSGEHQRDVFLHKVKSPEITENSTYPEPPAEEDDCDKHKDALDSAGKELILKTPMEELHFNQGKQPMTVVSGFTKEMIVTVSNKLETFAFSRNTFPNTTQTSSVRNVHVEQITQHSGHTNGSILKEVRCVASSVEEASLDVQQDMLEQLNLGEGMNQILLQMHHPGSHIFSCIREILKGILGSILKQLDQNNSLTISNRQMLPLQDGRVLHTMISTLLKEVNTVGSEGLLPTVTPGVTEKELLQEVNDQYTLSYLAQDPKLLNSYQSTIYCGQETDNPPFELLETVSYVENECEKPLMANNIPSSSDNKTSHSPAKMRAHTSSSPENTLRDKEVRASKKKIRSIIKMTEYFTNDMLAKIVTDKDFPLNLAPNTHSKMNHPFSSKIVFLFVIHNVESIFKLLSLTFDCNLVSQAIDISGLYNSPFMGLCADMKIFKEGLTDEVHEIPSKYIMKLLNIMRIKGKKGRKGKKSGSSALEKIYELFVQMIMEELELFLKLKSKPNYFRYKEKKTITRKEKEDSGVPVVHVLSNIDISRTSLALSPAEKKSSSNLTCTSEVYHTIEETKPTTITLLLQAKLYIFAETFLYTLLISIKHSAEKEKKKCDTGVITSVIENEGIIRICNLILDTASARKDFKHNFNLIGEKPVNHKGASITSIASSDSEHEEKEKDYFSGYTSGSENMSWTTISSWQVSNDNSRIMSWTTTSLQLSSENEIDSKTGYRSLKRVSRLSTEDAIECVKKIFPVIQAVKQKVTDTLEKIIAELGLSPTYTSNKCDEGESIFPINDIISFTIDITETMLKMLSVAFEQAGIFSGATKGHFMGLCAELRLLKVDIDCFTTFAEVDMSFVNSFAEKAQKQDLLKPATSATMLNVLGQHLVTMISKKFESFIQLHLDSERANNPCTSESPLNVSSLLPRLHPYAREVSEFVFNLINKTICEEQKNSEPKSVVENAKYTVSNTQICELVTEISYSEPDNAKGFGAASMLSSKEPHKSDIETHAKETDNCSQSSSESVLIANFLQNEDESNYTSESAPQATVSRHTLENQEYNHSTTVLKEFKNIATIVFENAMRKIEEESKTQRSSQIIKMVKEIACDIFQKHSVDLLLPHIYDTSMHRDPSDKMSISEAVLKLASKSTEALVTPEEMILLSLDVIKLIFHKLKSAFFCAAKVESETCLDAYNHPVYGEVVVEQIPHLQDPSSKEDLQHFMYSCRKGILTEMTNNSNNKQGLTFQEGQNRKEEAKSSSSCPCLTNSFVHDISKAIIEKVETFAAMKIESMFLHAYKNTNTSAKTSTRAGVRQSNHLLKNQQIEESKRPVNSFWYDDNKENKRELSSKPIIQKGGVLGQNPGSVPSHREELESQAETAVVHALNDLFHRRMSGVENIEFQSDYPISNLGGGNLNALIPKPVVKFVSREMVDIVLDNLFSPTIIGQDSTSYDTSAMPDLHNVAAENMLKNVATKLKSFTTLPADTKCMVDLQRKNENRFAGFDEQEQRNGLSTGMTTNIMPSFGEEGDSTTTKLLNSQVNRHAGQIVGSILTSIKNNLDQTIEQRDSKSSRLCGHSIAAKNIVTKIMGIVSSEKIRNTLNSSAIAPCKTGPIPNLANQETHLGRAQFRTEFDSSEMLNVGNAPDKHDSSRSYPKKTQTAIFDESSKLFMKTSENIFENIFKCWKYNKEQTLACVKIIEEVLREVIQRVVTDLGHFAHSLQYFLNAAIHYAPHSSGHLPDINLYIAVLTMDSSAEIRHIANEILRITLDETYSIILSNVKHREAATTQAILNSPTKHKAFFRTSGHNITSQKKPIKVATAELVLQVKNQLENFVNSRLRQLSVMSSLAKEFCPTGKFYNEVKEPPLPKVNVDKPLLILPSFITTNDPKALLSRVYVSPSVLEHYTKHAMNNIFQVVLTELKLSTYEKTLVGADMSDLHEIATAMNTIRLLRQELHYDPRSCVSLIDKLALPRHELIHPMFPSVASKHKSNTENPFQELTSKNVNMLSIKEQGTKRVSPQRRIGPGKQEPTTKANVTPKLTKVDEQKLQTLKETSIHENIFHYLRNLSKTKSRTKLVGTVMEENKEEVAAVRYLEQTERGEKFKSPSEMTTLLKNRNKVDLHEESKTANKSEKENSFQEKHGKLEDAVGRKSPTQNTSYNPKVVPCALERRVVMTPPDSPPKMSQPPSKASPDQSPTKNFAPCSQSDPRGGNTTEQNRFDLTTDRIPKHDILTFIGKRESMQIPKQPQQTQAKRKTPELTSIPADTRFLRTSDRKHENEMAFNTEKVTQIGSFKKSVDVYGMNEGLTLSSLLHPKELVCKDQLQIASNKSKLSSDAYEISKGMNLQENEKNIYTVANMISLSNKNYLGFDVHFANKPLNLNTLSPIINEAVLGCPYPVQYAVTDAVSLNTELAAKLQQHYSVCSTDKKIPEYPLHEEGQTKMIKTLHTKVSDRKQLPHSPAAAGGDTNSLDGDSMKSLHMSTPEHQKNEEKIGKTTAEGAPLDGRVPSPTRFHSEPTSNTNKMKKEKAKRIVVTVEELHAPKMKYSLSYNANARRKFVSVSPDSDNSLAASSCHSCASFEDIQQGQSSTKSSDCFQPSVSSENLTPQETIQNLQNKIAESNQMISSPDTWDKSVVAQGQHLFTSVYHVLFLEDILSRLLCKILFTCSINAMCDRHGEPYEYQLVELTSTCLKSMLLYLTKQRIQTVNADISIQPIQATDKRDINKIVHTIYCSIIKEYGSQRKIYMTLINSNSVFAEMVISLVLKQISDYALKGNISELLTTYSIKVLNADEIMEKVKRHVCRSDSPWTALSMHSTLLFASTCLQDIILNLLTIIFPPQAKRQVLSESEFSIITTHLRHRVLCNISKDNMWNMNNSNVKQDSKIKMDVQNIAESVHSDILEMYTSPWMIQEAFANNKGVILERIWKIIILEMTHHLQPFLSDDLIDRSYNLPAEYTVAMSPVPMYCQFSGNTTQSKFCDKLVTNIQPKPPVTGIIHKTLEKRKKCRKLKNLSVAQESKWLERPTFMTVDIPDRQPEYIRRSYCRLSRSSLTIST